MADQARFIFSKGVKKAIGNIFIDAFSVETHSKKSNITSYPIEDNSTITDHVLNLPLSLNTNGIIEPIDDNYNILDTHNKIVDLMNSKQLISIITGLKVYNNMIILDYTVTRNAQNGQSLVFTMQAQETKIAQSQSVAIPISQLSQADLITYEQSQANADAGKATSGQTQTTNFLDGIEQAANDIVDGIAKKLGVVVTP